MEFSSAKCWVEFHPTADASVRIIRVEGGEEQGKGVRHPRWFQSGDDEPNARSQPRHSENT